MRENRAEEVMRLLRVTAVWLALSTWVLGVASAQESSQETGPMLEKFLSSSISVSGRPCGSFVYDGQPSSQFLGQWHREEKKMNNPQGSEELQITWHEPGGGLAATWTSKTIIEQGAVEFGWSFANEGRQPTRILSDVLSLDWDVVNGVLLSYSSGGGPGDFNGDDLGLELSQVTLADYSLGNRMTLGSLNGRSSTQFLPFFTLSAPDQSGGVFVGIGWTGEWRANFEIQRAQKTVRMTAQMPGIHLILEPGEKITTPTILLGSYQGGPAAGARALRRTLYERYMPRLGSERPEPPVSWNSWFQFGNGITEELLRPQIDIAATLGIEYFCIDGGWYEGDFPEGVGNWIADPKKFPDGFGSLGRYVASKGMKMGLWFEPERVATGTRLLREHPEWVHGNLLDLGNKDAREWAFQMMSRFIKEGQVGWIRFDFNIDPLVTWEQMDTGNRRGMAQIAHIEGVYELEDRLRAAFPELLIENCASGGRRMDLEIIKRSHTYWKSDQTYLLPVMTFHETGGNCFLPGVLLNANLLGIEHAPFDIHSLFGGPLGFGVDWVKLSEPLREQTRQQIALYKQVRRLLNEDYYPLFPQARNQAGWTGWQFHDPEADEGFVVLLRPAESAYEKASIRLHGVRDERSYRLTETATDSSSVMTGQALKAGWPLDLQPAASQVIRYAPAP